MRRPGRRLARGAETIEVALTLPVVLLVIFCGFEYGWAMVRVVQLDHAARIGARMASMSGASVSEVESTVQDALHRHGIEGATVAVTPGDLSSVQPGTTIDVEVHVPYSHVQLIGIGRLMPMPQNLRGHASMAREPDA